MQFNINALGVFALLASNAAAQGLQWNKNGPTCDRGNIPRSCIVRGGDDQFRERTSRYNFSDAGNCHTRTTDYVLPIDFGFRVPNVPGPTACLIRIKPNDQCRLNGLSGAQEIGLMRRVTKRTPLGQADLNGDVYFNHYCTPGAWVASEIRIL